MLQVVNAFLFSVRSEQNQQPADHVYVFPSYLAVLWDRHVFDRWKFSSVSFVIMLAAGNITATRLASQACSASVSLLSLFITHAGYYSNRGVGTMISFVYDFVCLCVCLSALDKKNGSSYQHRTCYTYTPWQSLGMHYNR